MAGPSAYELRAWREIQRFKGRPLSRVMGNASRRVAIGTAELGERATKYLECQRHLKTDPLAAPEF